MRAHSRFIVFAAIFTLIVSSLPFENVSAQEAAGDTADSRAAIVTSDAAVVLRAAPTELGQPVLEIPSGSEVEITILDVVVDEAGVAWSQVIYNGTPGFLPSNVLSTLALPPAQPVESIPAAVTRTVFGSSQRPADCYDQPSIDGALIIALETETTIEIAGDQIGDWQPVICNGIAGYLAVSVFSPPVADTNSPPEPELTVPNTEAPATSTPSDTAEVADPTDTVVTSTPTPEIPFESPTAELDISPSASEEVVAGDNESSQPELTEETAQQSLEDVSATPVPTATANAEASTENAESTVDAGAAVEQAVFAAEVSALTASVVVYGTGGAGVRCRAAGSTEAEILTVLAEGASVPLADNWTGNWQAVHCAGKTGYVWSQYLNHGTDETPPAADDSDSRTNSSGMVKNTHGKGLRCRASAGLDGAIITVVPEGAALLIRGALEGDWQPVTCADREGYVFKSYFGVATDETSTDTTDGSNSANDGSSNDSGQSLQVANTGSLGVRFRASASYSAAIIAVLPDDTIVTSRSGSQGVWAAVSYSGKAGFVHSDYLEPASSDLVVADETEPSVETSDLAIGSHAEVLANLRLRSGPSYSAAIINVSSQGTVVEITGAKQNGFYAVTWNGTDGYMHGDYLVWTDRPLTRGSTSDNSGTGGGLPSASTGGDQSIVSYALQYVGYPYVWATHGPDSFDCSGFTNWVIQHTVGLQIWYSVTSQWGYGSPVSRASLQPGDLVFFQNTYQFGLSHVGIYIGNGQFVHASNETTGVIISNLDANYYATRWYGARRMA